MNYIERKKKLTAGFSAIGLFSVLEQHYLRNKAFVLMYHRILDPSVTQKQYVQPGMYVSALSFSRQIAFLKDRFNVIFLDDLVDKVLGGVNVGSFCAITFDDGWGDNFACAFPILKKYNVPATIFLATGFIGTERTFWTDEMCSCLDQNITDKAALGSAPDSYTRFNNEISRYRQCIKETYLEKSIEILKGYLPGDRREILEYFRSMLKADSIPRQMLNWDEAREMHSSGLVRFGAHTVNHEMLDQVPLQKAREEIVKSRSDIEYQLGNRVNTFAYPNGNYTEDIKNILAEIGFNTAVTTRKGFLTSSVLPMEVPRVAIHEDVSNTTPMFRSRILFSKF